MSAVPSVRSKRGQFTQLLAVTSNDVKSAPVTRQNQFDFASAKLNAENVSTKINTPDNQPLRPLHATTWSWVVPPKSSGNPTLYLGLTASAAQAELSHE